MPSNEQAEKLALQRKQFEEDLKKVVSTPAGLRFVARILAESGFGQTPYAVGSFDATAFNAGRQAVGAALFDAVARVAPNKLPKLIVKQGE